VVGKGYILVQENISQLHFPLTINPLLLDNGGSNGGYTLQMSGSGFPSSTT
jgi:hypothetical protein